MPNTDTVSVRPGCAGSPTRYRVICASIDARKAAVAAHVPELPRSGFKPDECDRR